MEATQSIRGMNDLLPDNVMYWHFFEREAKHILHSYGYAEIRTPIVEKTALFIRSIGEVTDIVEKEMYTFTDRNGDSLTLRPENTAGCVRAIIQSAQLNQIHRLWYLGPMFRHERPQKGRYRQFHQLGAEVFGIADPSADAELILLNARLWRALGINGLALELNSLGTPECRDAHRKELIGYFQAHKEALDEDSLRRLETNPLRILDSKNPEMQGIIKAAPQLLEYLNEESKEHLEVLQDTLRQAGVDYTLNPRLVRGLDYYTKTVFEWKTTKLGAQGTVCGGGRYDELIRQSGGRDTPGVGFSLGVERLIELIVEQKGALGDNSPRVFFAAVGEKPRQAVFKIAEEIREIYPELMIIVDADAGKFRTKLRRADRSNAVIALLIGEDELEANQVSVKHLRNDHPQEAIAVEKLAGYLKPWVNPGGFSPSDSDQSIVL